MGLLNAYRRLDQRLREWQLREQQSERYRKAQRNLEVMGRALGRTSGGFDAPRDSRRNHE